MAPPKIGHLNLQLNLYIREESAEVPECTVRDPYKNICNSSITLKGTEKRKVSISLFCI